MLLTGQYLICLTGIPQRKRFGFKNKNYWTETLPFPALAGIPSPVPEGQV